MRATALLTFAIFIWTACDPDRATRPIQVVAAPELVHRQSCQALLDAERKPQDEIVLTGTAEHGTPDVLRVVCEDGEHSLVFRLSDPPDDLGMKALRKQWVKRTSSRSPECPSCPKYNVRARFVGELRADATDSHRLLYLVRTADQMQRKRIRYASQR